MCIRFKFIEWRCEVFTEARARLWMKRFFEISARGNWNTRNAIKMRYLVRIVVRASYLETFQMSSVRCLNVTLTPEWYNSRRLDNRLNFTYPRSICQIPDISLIERDESEIVHLSFRTIFRPNLVGEKKPSSVVSTHSRWKIFLTSSSWRPPRLSSITFYDDATQRVFARGYRVSTPSNESLCSSTARTGAWKKLSGLERV